MGSSEFWIEEYRALRTEVMEKIKEIRTTETLAVAGAAALYAWAAHPHSAGAGGSLRIAWVVPIILPILGAWRHWVLVRQIGVLGEYLSKLEDALQTPSSPRLGWEDFKRKNAHKFNEYTSVVFWGAFIVATIVMPVVALKLRWAGLPVR